jgi:hypothetical protein
MRRFAGPAPRPRRAGPAVQGLTTAASRIAQDRLLQESQQKLALARLDREAAELIGEAAK